MLHVAGWAPGETIDDLSGQVISIQSPGTDCAADGRMFSLAVIRFGRVREDSAVASIDGTIEDMDPGSDARSELESDVRATVAQSQDPRWCLSCGTSLEPHATERDEFVGGIRVRLGATPVVCPNCAVVRRGAEVLSDLRRDATTRTRSTRCPTTASIGYTADCPAGHRYSGRLGG